MPICKLSKELTTIYLPCLSLSQFLIFPLSLPYARCSSSLQLESLSNNNSELTSIDSRCSYFQMYHICTLNFGKNWHNLEFELFL